MKPSITICIAACNEQLKIRKALESARACSWCSELLVFDSGSTDKTVEICQEYADRVEFHEWVDYSTSKRKMSEAASHDWVFILDADEEISPELAKEIEGLDDSIFRDHPVITMPRHNYLLGRWAKSWYPDRQNRLFDRHRTDWPYRSVHDFRVPKEGTEKHLRHPLLHNRHVDEWSDYFEGRRVENRANAIAQEMFDRGKRVGYFDLMVRPWISFVKYFFLKKGFTQGAFGLMQAQHRVLATQLKYAKLWYLQQVEKDKCLAPKGSQTKRVLPAAPSTDLKVQSNAPVTHQKKNVLVLCSDTFRHDALGAMHGHEVHTPHLDRLVEQSARFENFWCCSFPTLINRIEVFTGRCAFPHHPWGSIPYEYPTLGQVFQKHGYRTAMAADNPHLLGDGFEFSRGYDEILGVRGHGYDRFQMGNTPLIDLNCSLDQLAPNTRRVNRYRRNAWWYKQQGTSTTEQVFTRSFDWLKHQQLDQPFFLWMDVFDPHEPWQPPEKFRKKYPFHEQSHEVIWPKSIRSDYYTPRELENMKSLYMASVSHVDDWVGRLMDCLQSSDLLDNTIVVFCSDHGFYFGDHGMVGKIFRRDSGMATRVLEPLGHVPLLIRHPAALGAGNRNMGHAQPQDIYPTVLELAGLPPVEWVHGKSLSPFLDGDNTGKDFMVSGSHPHKKSGLTCLTAQTDEWVLVYDPVKGLKGSELYRRDIERVHSENVMSAHQDEGEKLFKRLENWFDEMEVPEARKSQMLFNKSLGLRRRLQLHLHRKHMEKMYRRRFSDYAITQ